MHSMSLACHCTFFNKQATPVIYTFPYTTLFRSEACEADWTQATKTRIEHFIGKDIVRFHAVFWPAMLMAAGQRTMSLDRKSTRLNSSHANISYAVFCLKKQILRALQDHDADGSS